MLNWVMTNILLVLALLIAPVLIITRVWDWRRQAWLRRNPMCCSSCSYSGIGQITVPYPWYAVIFCLLFVIPIGIIAYIYNMSQSDEGQL